MRAGGFPAGRQKYRELLATAAVGTNMRFGREVLQTDLYDVLGVPPSASADHLRRAYRRLVLRTHPDLDRDEPAAAARARARSRQMAEINVAAGILLDPVKRAAYDRVRRQAQGRRFEPAPVYARPWGWASDDAGEWTVPARGRAWARASAEARELLLRLRPAPGRAAERFSAWISQWTPRRHATVMAVSIVMALGLIAEARPKLLVRLFTPEPTGYASNR